VRRTTTSRSSIATAVTPPCTPTLGHLLATLLRAYRDQVAEVSHVHIEGLLDGAPYDLTVMFDVCKESMSPEEAKKLTSALE
jgi:hypothetical protein